MEIKTRKSGMGFGQFLIKIRTILILVALLIIFTILKPKFVNPTNLMNMIKRMSYVAITAFGITFVMTLGGLDLSGGSIAALTGVSLAYMLSKGVSIGIALPVVLVLALIMGLINAVIIVEGKIAPFLTTLATMNIYRGIALTLTAGRTVSIKAKGFTDFFGNGKLFDFIPIPVLITVFFLVVCWFLYSRTKLGYYCRCIGGNEEAAKVAGINIRRVKYIAYMFNALLAGFAGLILCSLMNAGVPDIGSDLSMDAISAAVLGGTAISGGAGSIIGTLGGGLIMAELNAGLSLLGAQSHVQILVKGIVIILAVLMDNALKSRTQVKQIKLNQIK